MRCYAMVAAALVFVAAVSVHAQGPKGSSSTPEEFEAKLGYQTGTVTLNDGMAKIQLPASFRFIGPEASKRLLTEAWGNPPEAADDVLGMLIPTATSPLTREGWGIVITYDEDGYVDDKDAAKMDYAKLLKEMQEAADESNEERKKQGVDTVHLVGWAEPPSYDRAAHKMYWAKDLVFGDGSDH